MELFHPSQTGADATLGLTDRGVDLPTAVTAQNTRGVAAIVDIPPAAVAAQIDAAPPRAPSSLALPTSG